MQCFGVGLVCTIMHFLEFLAFFLKLLKYHRIIFFDLYLKVISVSKSLLYFPLQILFVLNSIAAVGYELSGKFFYFICFLFELLDRFVFDSDHFFEVVTLEHEIRDSFFIVRFIALANLDENVESLVFEQ